VSFACVQNYLSTQFQTFQITNGECRFLRTPGADETDALGFVSSEFVARTPEFLPCSWSPVKADKTSEDSDVALQVRSTAVYEITVGQLIDGAPIKFLLSSRLGRPRCAERLGLSEAIVHKIRGSAAGGLAAMSEDRRF
jgi:hypothetical protein